MKKLLSLLMILLFSTLSLNAQQHELTVDDLWAMKRVGSVTLASNNSTIAYTVKTYSMETNKNKTDIWFVNPDGKNARLFMENASQPVFLPDGEKISYVKKGQVFVADLNGKNEKQITDLYTGVSGQKWSPDGKKLLFTSMVYPEFATQAENKAKDDKKAASLVNASMFTELFYKHWNDWRGEKRSHLFVYDLETKEYTDLNLFATYDVPTIALGSSNDYSWSPDGKEVAFCANMEKVQATSTNNDIYVIKIADAKAGKKTPFTLISKSKGNDNQPVYSPDGKYIAFRSMARAGFEADKQTLVLYNRKSGELKNLSEQHDISFGQLVWDHKSETIFFNSANEIYNSIYKFDIASKEVKMLKKEVVSGSMHLCSQSKYIFFANQKSTMPTEIFSMSAEGGKLNQLTFTNKERLANIKMNPLSTFWSEGANGAKVQSMIVKPPFFEEGKKYPLIFLIHGGPQGHWTDNFHYRWNAQMFAAKGYVVVATNPRGSVGYGQKFTDEISQDWGGKVYEDLMKALDHTLATYDFIDKDHIYAAGASYGGYMINWIEGHTDRFTALVCHAGVYNLTSMYGVTEELWFPEWEYGGTPWENPELYEKMSPHTYVDNFKTPMLVIHGAYDFRVPEGQAFELFTALQKKGVESKLLYFPDEYHFVVKPQNAKLWWNTIYDWFEEHNKR